MGIAYVAGGLGTPPYRDHLAAVEKYLPILLDKHPHLADSRYQGAIAIVMYSGLADFMEKHDTLESHWQGYGFTDDQCALIQHDLQNLDLGANLPVVVSSIPEHIKNPGFSDRIGSYVIVKLNQTPTPVNLSLFDES